MIVNVKLFGIPIVSIGEYQIKFSAKKTEALFYYLAVKKKCTKDEIATLLWENKNDQTAKHNLRNAIYQLRKTFHHNNIILSNGSSLYLNPNLKVSVDVDQFIKGYENSINFYTGEFLKGFYIKQAYEFVNWVDKKRLNYKELYISKLYKRIEDNMKKNAYDFIEQDCKTIITNDIYDERAYRILMKMYSHTGVCNKSIELYNQLVDILNQELRTSPDPETKALFDEIIIENSHKKNQYLERDKKTFFGRKKELLYWQNHFSLFLKGYSMDPVIIYGETGIGKSRLCQEFLKEVHDDEVYILKTYCFQEEEAFYLTPWHNIALDIADMVKTGHLRINAFSHNIISCLFPEFIEDTASHAKNQFAQFMELDYKNAEQEFINLLYQLAESKKVILVFEDIHWIDSRSSKLLLNLLKRSKNICFIATCRNIYNKIIDDFFTILNKYTPFYRMELSRFSKDETIAFANEVLKEYKLTQYDYDTIFRESEGNTFFLEQIFTNIIESGSNVIELSKIKNVLKYRLLGISDEGQNLLNIISLFYDEVSFDFLKEITNKDEFDILNTIEELKHQYLITERLVSGNLFVKITHKKLREFLYYEQPAWKRRIFHNKIGLLLEKKYSNNLHNHIIYSKLIYHFKNSENVLLELKYNILYLKYILEFKHMFYNDDIYFLHDYNIARKKVSNLFSQIKNKLNTIKPTTETNEDIKQLEIVYLYTRARNNILQCKYIHGLKLIRRMLKLAIEQDSIEYIINGYKIMIFYGIQTENKSFIEPYVSKGLALLEKCHYDKMKCLFIRYQGLYEMMNGNYTKSEELLFTSTKLLKKLCYEDNINYIYLSMNYYYLGELRRRNANFTEAIKCFEKAINICKENHLGEGLPSFRAKAGQSAFDNGDYGLAKKYLEESLPLYDKYWQNYTRSIASGYLTIIYIYNNQYTKALKSLKRADRYSKKVENPYEEGILNRIKAEIRLKMEKNQKLSKIFDEYLDLQFYDYYKESVKFLNMIEICYEKKVLENFKKQMDAIKKK